MQTTQPFREDSTRELQWGCRRTKLPIKPKNIDYRASYKRELQKSFASKGAVTQEGDCVRLCPHRSMVCITPCKTWLAGITDWTLTSRLATRAMINWDFGISRRKIPFAWTFHNWNVFPTSIEETSSNLLDGSAEISADTSRSNFPAFPQILC